MQNETTTNMTTIRLQSIGLTKGTEAGNLKKGDVTVWNFGFTETVLEIIKETPKTIVLKIQSDDSGNTHERRLNKNRIVGIK
jgi:hypothetical protein